MSEILLVRHGESEANLGNFTAFGNQDSPLTERGIQQAVALGTVFDTEYGVTFDFDQSVVASEFRRTQETAKYAGFTSICIDPVVNEARTIEIGISARV